MLINVVYQEIGAKIVTEIKCDMENRLTSERIDIDW